MHYNALKGPPSVPCGARLFFKQLKTDFRATAAIKQQRQLTNLTMMCSYRSTCREFPVALVGFQMEDCLQILHHVCQRENDILNSIDFDWGGGGYLSRFC